MRSMFKAWAALALLVAVPAHAAIQFLDEYTLKSYRYVDLRDLHQNTGQIKDTLLVIINQMQANPAYFAARRNSRGEVDPSSGTRVRFFPEGIIGPSGNKIPGTDTFGIENPRTEYRTNVIMGVEPEAVRQRQDQTGALVNEFDLVMFIHDSNVGYYFRRISVAVRWKAGQSTFSILGYGPEDINLQNTNFRVYGDLMMRKAILADFDAVSGNIRMMKVFPIGVGALDQSPVSGTVTSTTGELADGHYLARLSSVGNQATAYTRSRISPAYYRGRPFMGITNKEGNYTLIGFHFQMNLYGLERGFYSHGCIRTPDTPLYQMDAIVNEGPHARVPVDIRIHQPWLAEVDSPYPKIDDHYYAIVYRRDNIEKYGTVNNPPNVPGLERGKIACTTSAGKSDPYRVRYSEGFHTLEDNYCLSAIGEVKSSVLPALTALQLNGTAPVAVELQSGQVELGFEGGAEHGCELKRYAADDMQDSGFLPFEILGGLLNATGSRQRAEQDYANCVANARARQQKIVPVQPTVQQPQFVDAPVIETKGNGRFVPPADIPGGNQTTTVIQPKVIELPAPKPLVPATTVVETPVAKPTVTVKPVQQVQQLAVPNCSQFADTKPKQCKNIAACVECRIARNLELKAEYCNADWSAKRSDYQSYCSDWRTSYTSYLSYRK